MCATRQLMDFVEGQVVNELAAPEKGPAFGVDDAVGIALSFAGNPVVFGLHRIAPTKWI